MSFLGAFQTISVMPKLYLLGGENVSKRSALEVNEQAFQDAAKTPAVLVIPWARACFDKTYAKKKILVDYFISLGAGRIDFVDYSENKEIIADKIVNSNLIYITGGLVTALVERIKEAGIEDLLSDFSGVIVGRSAGALALCKKSVITGRCSKRMHFFEGFGLVDITVKAHYQRKNDDLLNLLSMQENIYAIPEGSAIVVERGTLSFINKVYLFSNGKKQRLN
jgi:dipeptidase E